MQDSKETTDRPDDVIVNMDNALLIVSFVNAPVPNGEADQNAAMNWMWQDAVSVVKNHKAHILVIVQGGIELKEKALLLTKAVATLLKQNSATSVFASGIVHPLKYYEVYSDMVRADVYPTPLHVWIGMSQHEGKAGMYTFGLRNFDKEEMEIYYDPTTTNPQEIQEFITNMADYVVTANVTFKDGETVGVSETHFCKISLSKGIALDGNTLKVDYIAE